MRYHYPASKIVWLAEPKPLLPGENKTPVVGVCVDAAPEVWNEWITDDASTSKNAPQATRRPAKPKPTPSPSTSPRAPVRRVVIDETDGLTPTSDDTAIRHCYAELRGRFGHNRAVKTIARATEKHTIAISRIVGPLRYEITGH